MRTPPQRIGAGTAGEEIPLDVYAPGDPDELAKLRDADQYDLMVVDLPGARARGVRGDACRQRRPPGSGPADRADRARDPDLRAVIRVVRQRCFTSTCRT